MEIKTKRVFLFDLDRTLFDVDLLKNLFVAEIQQVLNKSGVDHITARKLLYQYQNKLSGKPSSESFSQFEADEFLKFITKEISSNTELDNLKRCFYNPKIYKKAIFPETINVLQEIKNKYPHAILGIFSEGTKWQNKKIKLAELSQYFTNKNYILISENKLSDEIHERLANMPDKTVVVDDRLDILEKVATKHKHLTLVHLDRDSTDKDRMNNAPIITINNLENLLELEQLDYQ